MATGNAPVEWARNRRADAAELLTFSAVRRETIKLARNLGDLPLAVVTSAALDPRYVVGSRRRERKRSRFYPGWLVLQNELAVLSSNSKHVVAEYGGHPLNRENPGLAAGVITGLVQRVRSAG